MTEGKTKQQVCDEFNEANGMNAKLRWDREAHEEIGNDVWLGIENDVAFIFFNISRDLSMSIWSDIDVQIKDKNILPAKRIDMVADALSNFSKTEEFIKEIRELKKTCGQLEFEKYGMLEDLKGMGKQGAVISFAQDTILKAIHGGAK